MREETMITIALMGLAAVMGLLAAIVIPMTF